MCQLSDINSGKQKIILRPVVLALFQQQMPRSLFFDACRLPMCMQLNQLSRVSLALFQQQMPRSLFFDACRLPMCMQLNQLSRVSLVT